MAVPWWEDGEVGTYVRMKYRIRYIINGISDFKSSSHGGHGCVGVRLWGDILLSMGYDTSNHTNPGNIGFVWATMSVCSFLGPTVS